MGGKVQGYIAKYPMALTPAKPQAGRQPLITYQGTLA